MGNRTTGRPRLATASATANGRLPAPQMTASGLSSTRSALASSLIFSPGLCAANRDRQWPRACAYEGDDACDQRIVAALRPDRFEPLAKGACAEEHGIIGLAQAMNVRLGPAAPAHSNHVETHQVRERTLHKPERNDVRPHPAHSYHHGAFAYTHELAHGRLPAEDDEVAHADMPAEHDVVGEGDIVAHPAIMAHVRSHHEQAAIPHFGHTAIVLGAGVHGDTFADIEIGAD